MNQLMGSQQQIDNQEIIQRQLKRMEINEKIIKNLISPGQEFENSNTEDSKIISQKYSDQIYKNKLKQYS